MKALFVFDPGPAGSIGDVSWVIDARKSGKLPLLIVQGVLMTDLARAADVVLPGACAFEKDGAYVNQQGRLQAAARALTAPGDAQEDWQIFVNLAMALGATLDYTAAAPRPRRRGARARRQPDLRRARPARLRPPRRARRTGCRRPTRRNAGSGT